MKNDSAWHLFLRRKPRPEGKWSLAHPMREPVRFIAQSLIAWPAAALAAIMMAAPKDGFEQPAIILTALQVTVLYPIVAIVAIALHIGLARANFAQASIFPLIVPMAIVGVWIVTLFLFGVKYLLSLLGIN